MNIYKTMYRAPKPEGIEKRKAYIVGGGIAGLAAAVFLADDAGMPGENITILEKLPFLGGCMDGIGNYIRKPMHECTGEEIMTEVLYHLGLLDMKNELLAHTSISSCMMPYINSQFMPRKVTDRPRAVPEGCTNLGFIGQYVEVKDDAVFTVETSVRTAMEAVYTLTKLDRDVPEVYPSRFDIRCAVGHMNRFAGVKGKFTKADLPKTNPLMLLGLKKKMVEILNSVPSFPHLYTGRDQSVAEKESVLHPQYPIDV